MSGGRKCWCGRAVAADYPDASECEEHDGPIPAVSLGPSDPLTPGSVFGDQPVVMVCGVPEDAPAELWAALAEVGRAAMDAEDRRRLALTVEERAAEDARRAAAQKRIHDRVLRLRGGR